MTSKERITALKKSLDETKKLYDEAKAQYDKALALYNQAQAAVIAVAATIQSVTQIASSMTGLQGLQAAADAAPALAQNINNQRANANKKEGVAKKLEKSAKKELEKTQKYLDGLSKRIAIITAQLQIATSNLSLSLNSKKTQLTNQLKVKQRVKKVKFNKAKAKKALIKVVKALGPVAAAYAVSRIVNIQLDKLAQVNARLGQLVDKTNDIIVAAQTKEDLTRAKIARDAALIELQKAEDKLVQISKLLETIQTIITVISLLIVILEAIISISITPGTPLPLKPAVIIVKFTLLATALNVLIGASLITLSGLIDDIAYQRSRLLPLGNILDEATSKDLSPEEARNLLDTGGLGPVIGLEYRGFTFSILEEDDPRFVVAGNKRRYAVALDRSGFIALQSDPSFTLDPQVLIDELKLKIDEQNLEA
jgi:hypothetical protein